MLLMRAASNARACRAKARATLGRARSRLQGRVRRAEKRRAWASTGPRDYGPRTCNVKKRRADRTRRGARTTETNNGAPWQPRGFTLGGEVRGAGAT
eukprot:5386731-Pyramimonas_sp.AAC.1